MGAARVGAKRLSGVVQEYERATFRWLDSTANVDGTHDFPQCYTVSFIEKSIEVDTSAREFTRAYAMYPLFAFYDDWGIVVEVRNFLTLLAFGLVLVMSM